MSTYLCSHCGWHPDNSPRWCGSGCGSDFNRMIPTERADALDAAGETIRRLERWRMDAQSRAFKAEDRVRELEAILVRFHDENPNVWATFPYLAEALEGEKS